MNRIGSAGIRNGGGAPRRGRAVAAAFCQALTVALTRMVTVTLTLTLTLTLALALASTSLGQSETIQVSAGLEEDYILLGGVGTLVVTVTSNGVISVPAPQIVSLPTGLTLTPMGGRQISRTMVNGVVTATEVYRYQIYGAEAGEHVLNGISVVVGNQRYVAPAVTIPVIRPEQADQFRRKDPNLFAEVEFSKPEVYVGEQVDFSLVLWQRAGLRVSYAGIQDFDAASLFKGFIWQTVEDRPRRLTAASSGGASYERTLGFRIAVFPIGAGEYQVGPLTAVAEQGSFFDARRYAVQTNVATLRVLPIPDEGRPAEFAGAVGEFSMTTSVDREVVDAGDLVTLRVRIQGIGNIENLPSPVLPDLSGFDQFDPRSNRQKQRIGERLGGEAVFEYLLSPKSVEANTIGPVRFAYFHPETHRFQLLSTQSIHLSVNPAISGRGGAVPLPGAASGPQGVVVLGEDFRHIATDSRALRQDGGLSTFRAFPAYAAIPLILLAGTFAVRRRRDARERDPAFARRADAFRQARKRLAAAESLTEVVPLYAEMARVLSGYLTDTLGRSVAGLTSPEIRNRLEGHGLPAELIDRVIGFLDRCDAVRFGAGVGAMTPEHLRGETRTLLEALQRAGLGRGDGP